jgi:hypothetical protein
MAGGISAAHVVLPKVTVAPKTQAKVNANVKADERTNIPHNAVIVNPQLPSLVAASYKPSTFSNPYNAEARSISAPRANVRSKSAKKGYA